MRYGIFFFIIILLKTVVYRSQIWREGDLFWSDIRQANLNSRAAGYLWFETDFFIIISVCVEFKIIINNLFLSTNLEERKTIEKML